MNRQNKLATMPIRPLLYTMAVPLMLSLLLLFELFLSPSHLPLRQSYAVTSPLDLEMVLLLIPCLLLLLKTVGIRYAWYAFWIAEIIACVYSYCASRKLLRKSLQ